MYAVIFTATINETDTQYLDMAKRLRERAFKQYGCTSFTAFCENGIELAVSHWPSREHIKAWHADPLHQQAQALGKAKWYLDYKVEVTQILK